MNENETIITFKICFLLTHYYYVYLKFLCTYLNKCTPFFQTLDNDLSILDGSKPQCSICEKSFTRKGNLVLHQSIHTREKPFNCDQCKNSFRNKSDLKRHVLFHTGEKSF